MSTAIERSVKERRLTQRAITETLKRFNLSFDRFVEVYDSLPRNAGGRGLVPSPPEVSAVDAFIASGDFDALTRDLGVKTASAAHAAVTRVVAWRVRRGEPVT